MHEVSIIEGILAHISEQKKKYNFSKVLNIEILCGKYNCASEDNLNFCFHAAAKENYLKDAVINITRLSEKYKCDKCEFEFFEDFVSKRMCTKCGANDDVYPVLNSEIYLNKLEVE